MVNVATNMVSLEREIDGVLMQLRNIVHARGYTQLEVQERLGWGRSYLSQLLTKQKSLRFEQLILVLAVIGVDPGDFFGELYHWPERSAEEAEATRRVLEPTPEGADREIDRLLGLLLTKIKERGFTQLKIQQELGWGRNYISHLFTRAKHLRMEQVLAILWVLEVESEDFFFELYRPADFHSVSQVGGPDEAARVRRELDQLRSMVRFFGRLLVDKGWLEEEDLPPEVAEPRRP